MSTRGARSSPAWAVPAATRSPPSARSAGWTCDDLKPSLPVAIDNITNGNAEGMPAWAGQLTKTQIQNVAAFVYCATNKGATEPA